VKVTLIHPCIGRIPGKDYIKSWQMEALPPAQLAALTPSGIEVVFHDDRLEPIPFDDPTDLVALSVETYTAKRAYQIATEYRRRGIPVVMGGFHATLVPDEVQRYAEAIVLGEAEETWPRLLEDFRSGGLCRRYQAERRPALGSVRPDRRIFAGKHYLDLRLLEASRGCRMSCDFCAIQTFFASTHRRREVASIVEEIRSFGKNPPLLFFVDDNLVATPAWTKELCRAIEPLGVQWVGQAAITMTRDEELLELLHRSGCQGVLIGFESLDPRNLAAMGKTFAHTDDGLEAALERLRRHHLRLYATFVFGYEHDTLESFERTVEFCRQQRIFMVAFNHLTPFPGTPLYKRLEAQGRLLFPRWWLDDAYRYGMAPFSLSLPAEVVTERCVAARKAFYSLASIAGRLLEPTNTGNRRMFQAYVFINLLLRKEAAQREGYPLGDLTFRGPLLEVGQRRPVQVALGA